MSDLYFDIIIRSSSSSSISLSSSSQSLLSSSSSSLSISSSSTSTSNSSSSISQSSYTILYELESLDHDIQLGDYNSLIELTPPSSPAYSVLAYMGNADKNGKIKTFSMNSTGGNITQIESLEHDSETLQNNEQSLVKLNNNLVMLAYAGTNAQDGYIKTFAVSASGTSIGEVNQLEHDTNESNDEVLVAIDSTHAILAYRDGSDNGYLKTFSCDADGNNIAQIDSLLFVENGYFPTIEKIDSTHFIVSAYDGYIRTFSIDGSYDNITEIDNLSYGSSPRDIDIIQIKSDLYMLAYYNSNNGYLKTFSIDGSYNITEIDSLNHTTGYSYQNKIVKLDDTYSVLIHSDGSNMPILKAFSINTSGGNITELASLAVSAYGGSNGAYSMYLMNTDGNKNYLALAQLNGNNDGIVRTFRAQPSSSSSSSSSSSA